jgi:hypothetical protein
MEEKAAWRPPSAMEIVLDAVYQLYPRDSKTNVYIDVPVPRDFWRLEFYCSYTPENLGDREQAKALMLRALEQYVPEQFRGQYGGNWESYLPVSNLITLSIDCPDRYLGCAHRHGGEQRHIISADYASPGFYPQAAQKGLWRGVLNVHSVVSDVVVCRLTVRGCEKGEGQDAGL